MSYCTPAFMPTDYPKRKRPAEYVEGMGWFQDDRRRRVKKPYHHFIWPKDGKNGSKWGRTKDIFAGKGPDIYVTSSADKMDYMQNRPRRPQWSRHTNLDDRGPDSTLSAELPWVRGHRRYTDKRYDFWRRTYRRPDSHMWTDAIWPEEAEKNHPWPSAWRDINGEWIQHYPGGLEQWWDENFGYG